MPRHINAPADYWPQKVSGVPSANAAMQNYVSIHEHQIKPNPALAVVHGQAALLLRHDVVDRSSQRTTHEIPMKSIEPELYPGIDYDFRPFYWTAAANPLEAALRNVKGRQRRDMLREYYAAGQLEGLSDNLLNDSLDDMARKRLSQIHPTFMGGEYLPDCGRNEVEIVRIELESTIYDVISLRARPAGSRIEYSLVDEYNSEFTLPQRTSQRPFSLRQLIRFLDLIQQVEVDDPSWNRFGFVLSFNQCNLECGADLEDLSNFTRVYSDQYPDLASHYSQKIAEWRAAQEQTEQPRTTHRETNGRS